MESLTATATATGTAGVIRAAHAEIVCEAKVSCMEAVVFRLPTVEIPVARLSSWTPTKQISQGYNYHYNHAPGAYLVNSSCMNSAGASSGSWRFDVREQVS